MKKITYLSICLCLCTYLQAQTTPTEGGNSALIALNQLATDYTAANDLGKYKGTPYETEHFQRGLVFYNKQNLGPVYYRYNIYADQVEIKSTPPLENEEAKALNKSKETILVQMNGKELLLKRFTEKTGNTLQGYLSQISTGKTYTLYSRQIKTFTQGKAAKSSFEEDKPSKFIGFTQYYLSKDNHSIKEISLKSSKFIKSIDKGKQQKLKNFIKENSLKLKNEEQLIRVIIHLNQ